MASIAYNLMNSVWSCNFESTQHNLIVNCSLFAFICHNGKDSALSRISIKILQAISPSGSSWMSCEVYFLAFLRNHASILLPVLCRCKSCIKLLSLLLLLHFHVKVCKPCLAKHYSMYINISLLAFFTSLLTITDFTNVNLEFLIVTRLGL